MTEGAHSRDLSGLINDVSKRSLVGKSGLTSADVASASGIQEVVMLKDRSLSGLVFHLNFSWYHFEAC